MGSCISALSKAEIPRHAGKNSTSVQLAPPTEGEILQSPNLKSFAFTELKKATKNFGFNDKFGCVFKGWIDKNTFTAAKQGTGIVVAVEYLYHTSDKQWLAETNILGQLHHPNLVKLVGYCLKDVHPLLVYEFMQQGSLANHLFRTTSSIQPLSWNHRMKVALGAAKGLAYLHSREEKVMYSTFKSSNILLDSDFNAKLSISELAKKDKRSDGVTPLADAIHVFGRVPPNPVIICNFAYASPEYLTTGNITVKNNVYNFGVILLELLTGRRAGDKEYYRLVEWARPYLTTEAKTLHIMDPCIEGQYSEGGALRAAAIAKQCVKTSRKLRPNMNEVVNALEQLQEPDTKERAGRGNSVNSL